MVHRTVLLLKPTVKYTAKWLLRSLQGFPKCAMVSNHLYPELVCVQIEELSSGLCSVTILGGEEARARAARLVNEAAGRGGTYLSRCAGGSLVPPSDPLPTFTALT